LALRGTPVKLIWSREEDIRHDMYRPAAVARLRGALDDKGMLLAINADVSVQSVRQDFAKRNLPYPMSAAGDPMNVEGINELAYSIPNIRITGHAVKLPVPVGNWRSVGNSQNAFFAESFIDEMAHLAKVDPFEFRLKLLHDQPRWRALAMKLKEVSNWGGPLQPATARGVAIVECFRTIAGQVARVRVADGRIKVERVDCVVDCGTVVNPDIVRAQIQSGVIYGLTAALYGKISYADGAVVESNFHDYSMLRMTDAPDIVVHIMPSTEPPGGIGEPGTPPIAAAVANAVFAATGKRIRSLPIVLASA
jgi:isoquinoline 1-oxidoreductase subunit beta